MLSIVEICLTIHQISHPARDEFINTCFLQIDVINNITTDVTHLRF